MESYWEEINLLYNSAESIKNDAVSLERGGEEGVEGGVGGGGLQ